MDTHDPATPDPGPDDKIVAAVLAGGAASRMNGEKAEAVLAGRPLVEYPATSLIKAGLKPFLVTKADRHVSIAGVRTVVEPSEPRHPLLGIATALRAAGGAPVLVVACDLPFLPSSMLAWLASRDGAAVMPRVSGHLQPLAALYQAECLEVIEEGLKAARSVKSTVLDLAPVVVEAEELARFGDPATCFHNVNTPADLAWAERHLAEV